MRPCCRGAMTLGIAVLVGCLATAAFGQAPPALLPVPDNLPEADRAALIKQRADLTSQIAALGARVAAHNAKSVTEGSPEEAALRREGDQLRADMQRLVDAVNAYNATVATKTKAAADKPDKAAPPAKVTMTRIGAIAANKGEFTIENLDGSRFTQADSVAGAAVGIGTRITTGPTGHLQVLLLDETVFTIGPNGDMVLDDFVYDPDTSVGKLAARVTKGIFRFVTGKVARKNPASMKVTLPVGTIGIRGTDFESSIDADGSGYIKLFSGKLEITPNKGGDAFVMQEKTQVTFKADGTFSKPEPLK